MKSKMAHQMTGMAGMKHPTNTLGKGITGIDDTTEVGEEDMASLALILDDKILDIDVTRAFILSVDSFSSWSIVGSF